MSETPSNFAQWRTRMQHEVWDKDPAEHSPLGQWLVWGVRLLQGILRQFTDGQLNMQARGLAYTTLLSLVPLLAVSFSVLKAFGAYNQLKPALEEFLDPLGAQGREVSAQILDFVGNLQVGVLGAVGVAMLFYTVISLLQTIEQTFNSTWRVPDTRSPARRFSDYLSVVLIGPVLIFAALSLTGTVMSYGLTQQILAIQPLGGLLIALGHLGPYLLVASAFAFLYGFMPNTRVQIGAALAGGLFAGVLWYASGQLFARFVVKSSTYSAIYSGFASAILFILWLYISWLIILVGAQVAYYWQHPERLDPQPPEPPTGRRREELALAIMALVAAAHHHKQPPPSIEQLQEQLQETRPNAVAEIVDALQAQGFIAVSGDDPPVYLPGYDIGKMNLQEIIAAVRGQEHTVKAVTPAVTTVMGDIGTAIARSLQNRTVRDLLGESAD